MQVLEPKYHQYSLEDFCHLLTTIMQNCRKVAINKPNLFMGGVMDV